MTTRVCAVNDCKKNARHRGWCPMHYQRWRRHGSLADPTPTLEERFWSKVDASGDCWEWTAYIAPTGYGTFHMDRPDYAHRIAWELLVGPIPEGLEIDHLCRNRACVNPDHLEPVDHATNVRRGGLKRTPICPQGHPKTIYGGSYRCRPCTLADNRRRKRKRTQRQRAAAIEFPDDEGRPF